MGNAFKYKINNARSVNANDPYAIKVLLKSGPVAATISASSPIFKFYSKGIIDDKAPFGGSHMKCNTGRINHGVTIVGWGKDKNFDKEYFIIKNSFGTDWGEDGFAKIATGNDKNLPDGSCGILTHVMQPKKK